MGGDKFAFRLFLLLLTSPLHAPPRIWKLNKWLLLASLPLAFIGGSFGATYQVQVRVNVLRGCMLATQARDVGLMEGGTLDFGTAARLDSPAGPLDTQLPPAGFARLECNPDTAYQLQVDGGSNGGIAETRYLATSEQAAKPIPYRLYRDPARQLPLMVDVPVSGTVPGTGIFELPLYARIDRVPEVPVAGSYSDTLRVTLTW